MPSPSIRPDVAEREAHVAAATSARSSPRTDRSTAGSRAPSPAPPRAGAKAGVRRRACRRLRGRGVGTPTPVAVHSLGVVATDVAAPQRRWRPARLQPAGEPGRLRIVEQDHVAGPDERAAAPRRCGAAPARSGARSASPSGPPSPGVPYRPLWMRLVIAKNSWSPSMTSQRASIPAPAHVGQQRLQHLGHPAADGGRVDVQDRAPVQRRLRRVGHRLEAAPSAPRRSATPAARRPSAWTSTSFRRVAAGTLISSYLRQNPDGIAWPGVLHSADNPDQASRGGSSWPPRAQRAAPRWATGSRPGGFRASHRGGARSSRSSARAIMSTTGCGGTSATSRCCIRPTG